MESVYTRNKQQKSPSYRMAYSGRPTKLFSTYQDDYLNKFLILPPLRETVRHHSVLDDRTGVSIRPGFAKSPSTCSHRQIDEGSIPMTYGFDRLEHLIANLEEALEEEKSVEDAAESRHAESQTGGFYAAITSHGDTNSAVSTPQSHHTETQTNSDASSTTEDEHSKVGSLTPPSRKCNVLKCKKYYTNINQTSFNNLAKQRYLNHPINRIKHDQPEICQNIGCRWDKLQTRHSTKDGLQQIPRPNGKSKLANIRVLNRSRIEDKEPSLEANKRRHLCNIPGYSGHQPNLPIPMEKSCPDSTMTTTYRKFPDSFYKLPQYGRVYSITR